jgi:hypothetical protein
MIDVRLPGVWMGVDRVHFLLAYFVRLLHFVRNDERFNNSKYTTNKLFCEINYGLYYKKFLHNKDNEISA